jgi:hypothetical protein
LLLYGYLNHAGMRVDRSDAAQPVVGMYGNQAGEPSSAGSATVNKGFAIVVAEVVKLNFLDNHYSPKAIIYKQQQKYVDRVDIEDIMGYILHEVKESFKWHL